MKKEIKSDILKDSLIEAETISALMEENTTELFRNIVTESVQKKLNQLITEANEDEDNNDDDIIKGKDDDKVEDMNTDDVEKSDEKDDELTVVDDITDKDSMDGSDLDSDEDEWSKFDKYKISQDSYDFSNAKEEDLASVWKLLDDDDLIHLKKIGDDSFVLDDEETDNKYLIDVNNEMDSDKSDDDNLDDDDITDENSDMDDDSMVEIILNDEEPISEEDIEEGGGAGRQRGAAANHVGSVANDGKNLPDGRPHRVGAQRVYEEMKKTLVNALNETKKIKAEAIALKKENEDFKKVLGIFKNKLSEAAMVNYNLGHIVKIITENATTQAEKREIVERFQNEAKTIAQSKALCESISANLKSKLNEKRKLDTILTAEPQKINETTIYQDDELNKIKDMYKRLSLI
jgi:hypothetical protein